MGTWLWPLRLGLCVQTPIEAGQKARSNQWPGIYLSLGLILGLTLGLAQRLAHEGVAAQGSDVGLIKLKPARLQFREFMIPERGQGLLS